MTPARSLHSAAPISSAVRTDDQTADVAQAAAASFSRPTLTRLGAGNTHPVKTLVPLEVKEDFARRARLAGYSGEGDCLRELVIAFTYGVEFLHSLHRERIARLSEIGSVNK